MTDQIALQKVNPEKGEFRFYRLTLLPPGEAWRVWYQWGRLGKSPKELFKKFDSGELAKAAFEKMLAEKKKEGYVPLESSEIPESYTSKECRFCAQASQETKLSPSVWQIVFRDHIPREKLDMASLVRWESEIRGLIKGKKADLLFPSGNHARVIVFGRIETPAQKPVQVPEENSNPKQLNWLIQEAP